MSIVDEIAAERKRQVEVEGWTPEHDDKHSGGEMLRVAVIYYQHAAKKDIPLQFRGDGAPLGWPWDASWWKPKNDRRDLVRAGALCLAESERCRRNHLPTSPAEHKYGLIIKALENLVGAEP